MKQTKLRLGISMRRMKTEYELRDSLATNWTFFLAHTLPNVSWISLPNIETAILNLVQNFKINAFILSGGEDWGIFPERDKTEMLLLEFAQKYHLPVLGVCRGAQIINRFCGGTLSTVSSKKHIAVRHEIDFYGNKVEVNSFHRFGISPNKLGNNLITTGTDNEGNIEAFSHISLPWKGIIWHPEREKKPAQHDVHLFQNLFLKNEK